MKRVDGFSRFISVIVAFTLILTLFPITSYADSNALSGERFSVAFASGSKPGSFSAFPETSNYTTADNVVIMWTLSKGATKYGLTVVNDKTNKVVFDQYVTGNSKNIGILPEGKYRFQMAAYNNYGVSPFTSKSYFSVKLAACTPVPTSKAQTSSGSDRSNSTTPDFKSKDKDGNLYYKKFLANPSQGCVLYAVIRVREKLGYYIGKALVTKDGNPLSSGDAGKDLVKIWSTSDQAIKGIACVNSQTDKNYTIVSHCYNGLSEEEIFAAASKDIKGNSIVSFGSNGSVDSGFGHVIFVEYIKNSNGQIIVWFTEGGSLENKDGILQSETLENLVVRGGGMIGIASFIPIS